MIYHRYNVSGMTSEGNTYESECIADSINSAINLYQNELMRCSVHSIIRAAQVSANEQPHITLFKEVEKDPIAGLKNRATDLWHDLMETDLTSDQQEIVVRHICNLFLHYN